MNKQTEALKLALEALEELKYSSSSHAADDIYYKAITAIREALAEQPAQQQVPERMKPFVQRHHITSAEFTAFHVGFCCGEEFNKQQEPVADSKTSMLADCLQANYEADEIDEAAEELRRLFRENQLLWKEREEPHRQLEFYIRECNRLESERDAALTKQQEPVAWTLTETLNKRETTTRGYLWFSNPQNCSWTPLYTSPPASKPWVGLTDEEKADLFEGTAPYYNEVDYADAIEAKLREKNA